MSAPALAASPLGRLVHQQASPIIKLIVAEIPADDAFVVQLACETLHSIIRERFAGVNGGVQTSLSGMVSSVARFEWVRGWPKDSQPEWLTRWDSIMCSKIARGGGLEVLKHVRERGCEWDASTCYYAAGGGHLEVLKWLRANGCEWGESTCAAAAQGGRLEVLKWLRANGCPWDLSTYQAARDEEHHDLLEWAVANGCDNEDPDEYISDGGKVYSSHEEYVDMMCQMTPWEE